MFTHPSTKPPTIFHYRSYRSWLKDSLDFLRYERSICVADVCRALGLKNLGYLNMVVRGKRNLHRKRVEPLKELFGLNSQEASFLKLLIEYENPLSVWRKNELKQEIESMAKTSLKLYPKRIIVEVSSDNPNLEYSEFEKRIKNAILKASPAGEDETLVRVHPVIGS